MTSVLANTGHLIVFEAMSHPLHDVINNAEAFDEMIELSGLTLAPTMTYGSLVLADFGVPELEEFIEENGIEPED